MDVEITKSNGRVHRLSEYGVVKDFIANSIESENVKGTIEGRPGSVDYGVHRGDRIVTVPFTFKPHNFASYTLMRDELYGILNDEEPFYIREMRRTKPLQYDFVDFGEKPRWSEGTDNEYASGKRLKVRLSNTLTPEQIYTNGEINIEFVTSELPYFESIGTTADIQADGMDAEDGIWSAGMGLTADPASRVYSHDAVVGERFRVYNPGNVSVHPFHQDLKMLITRVRGSDEMFQITNHANGSRARVEVPVTAGHAILYDGPNVTRNGLQFLRSTRKDFVELSPGWNELEIYFCSEARIEFDFRAYYL